MQAKSVVVAAAACAIGAVSASLFAGSLTPPAGPVAGTFKTMQEVEPRIAVSSVNTPGSAFTQYIISQPGSYYLTGDIVGVSGKNGIEINSDNVTLDLNGFELRGVPGALHGIRMSLRRQRVSLRNGVISNWGGDGASLSIDSGIVENVRFGNNSLWGLTLGSTSFGGRVSGCNFINNGGLSSSFGGGMSVGGGAVVENCSVYGSSGYGIQVNSFSLISRCAVWSTSADPGVLQSGTGVFASGSGVIVESTTSSLNSGKGIDITAGAGVVRGCSALFNSTGNVAANVPSVVVESVY